MASLSYGTATNLTSTVNSLASGSSVSLGVIDNTSALALDFLVEVSGTSGASVTGSRTVDIFAVSSVDGTNFSDTNVNNMRKIGYLFFSTNSLTVRSASMSIAQAFGGVVPPKVTIYAVNNSGANLGASGGFGQYRSVTVV